MIGTAKSDSPVLFLYQGQNKLGSLSRTKGKVGEREVVNMARECGLEAERTWQTAQCPDATTRACDVTVAKMPHQVKFYKRGFAALYAGLEGVAGLFVRENGREWLAVIPAETYLALLRSAVAQNLPAPSSK